MEDGRFAQSVEATLSGDDFEITPAGPVGMIATFNNPVEWNWRLKPITAGTKTLTIEVAAYIQVGATKQRVQINTLHETIRIQISAFQRVTTYLSDFRRFIVAVAALTTPLLALIGFVPRVRKFFGGLFVGHTPRRRA